MPVQKKSGNLLYAPTVSHEQDVTHDQFFMGSSTGLNCSPSLKPMAILRLKKSVCPTIYLKLKRELFNSYLFLENHCLKTQTGTELGGRLYFQCRPQLHHRHLLNTPHIHIYIYIEREREKERGGGEY